MMPGYRSANDKNSHTSPVQSTTMQKERVRDHGLYMLDLNLQWSNNPSLNSFTSVYYAITRLACNFTGPSQSLLTFGPWQVFVLDSVLFHICIVKRETLLKTIHYF